MKHISVNAVVNGVEVNSESELAEVLNNYTLPTRYGVLSRGAKFIVVGEDAGSEIVTPEYQAILNYATSQGYTLPSAGNQSQQNSLVAALKDAGIWAELDVFYCFATDGDADFSFINWINPGTFNGLPVGPITKTLNVGINGNGLSSYLDTQWIPLNGIKYQLDNASLFIYCNNSEQSTGVIAGTADANSTDNSIRINPRNTSDSLSYNVNCSTARTLTIIDGSGLWHLQRTLINSMSLFRNGISENTAGINSSAKAKNSLVVGGGNSNGGVVNHNGRIIGCLGTGSSLDSKESALYNAWNNYKNSLP